MRTVPTVDLSRVNPPIYDGAEDIAELTYLNEGSVVHNLKTRYSNGDIYVSPVVCALRSVRLTLE
jgi:myosin protein heavy chain